MSYNTDSDLISQWLDRRHHDPSYICINKTQKLFKEFPPQILTVSASQWAMSTEPTSLLFWDTFQMRKRINLMLTFSLAKFIQSC